MSDARLLGIMVAVLMATSFLCTCYIQSMNEYEHTNYDVNSNFPGVGKWLGPHNATVSQNFTQVQSIGQIGLTNVYGTWSVDAVNGLHPDLLINRAWLPWETKYEAKAKFGDVRILNNSWTESYDVANINTDATDYMKIVMLYASAPLNNESREVVLVIEGSEIYVSYDTKIGGYTYSSTPYTYGYNIPAGTTSGKISYVATYLNPVFAGVAFNTSIEIKVYWNDVLAFTHTYDSDGEAEGQNNRQACIITNIGSPRTAYTLNVFSHYEDYVITPYEAGVEGYNDAVSFVGTLLAVVFWPLPTGIPLPIWLTGIAVGIPELIIAYLLVRLVRGGG